MPEVTPEQVVKALLKRDGLLRAVVVEAIEGDHVTAILPWEQDAGGSGEEVHYRWRHRQQAVLDANYIGLVTCVAADVYRIHVPGMGNRREPDLLTAESAMNRADEILAELHPDWILL
jgi:hypothetical protein